MYPSLDLPTSVIAAPTGTAIAEGDGYRVSGRWGFGSGSTHCAWFFLGCLVFDGDELRIGADGMPETRILAVPAAEVTVLDTWHTTGLGATASNDVTVTDAFVPHVRGFNLFDDAAIDPSPLYRWRWNFFINIGGVPLGVARAALENARDITETKLSMPAMTPIREDPTVQANFAEATALTKSARAYLHDAVGTAWVTMQRGREPRPEEWYAVRLATTHAFHSCKRAVTLLYEALGTTGVYRTSVLDRQFRDITTMSQHLVAQTKTYAAAGRGLLGLDPAAVAF
jgi:alkylation response protein AidB-like acyl-CoA dehydrogenase